MNDQTDSIDALISKYVTLSTERERIEAEIRNVIIELEWNGDPLKSNLVKGSIRSSYELFGPIPNGHPGSVDRPERPDRPGRGGDGGVGPTKETLDRDRAARDKVIEKIRESNLSSTDKQRAIENVERQRQECVNAGKCLN